MDERIIHSSWHRAEIFIILKLQKAQWLLYVPPDLAFKKISTFCPTECFLCVLCGCKNKQRLFDRTALTEGGLGAFAINCEKLIKVKVKQSRYRLGVAQRVPES
jgi:hypothetical protein